MAVGRHRNQVHALFAGDADKLSDRIAGASIDVAERPRLCNPAQRRSRYARRPSFPPTREAAGRREPATTPSATWTSSSWLPITRASSSMCVRSSDPTRSSRWRRGCGDTWGDSTGRPRVDTASNVQDGDDHTGDPRKPAHPRRGTNAPIFRLSLVNMMSGKTANGSCKLNTT